MSGAGENHVALRVVYRRGKPDCKGAAEVSYADDFFPAVNGAGGLDPVNLHVHYCMSVNGVCLP